MAAVAQTQEKKYRVTVLGYPSTLGKINAIKKAKQLLGLDIKDAKEWVESLPNTLEDYTYDEAQKIKSVFDCYVMLQGDDYSSNYNIGEPDEATKEALAWRDALTDKEKEMINLITEWERPTFIAPVC